MPFSHKQELAGPHVVAAVEEFAIGTPAQELVDRFLIGYPRRGSFHRPGVRQMTVVAPPEIDGSDIERREADFGLRRGTDTAAAVADADCVLVVPRGAGDVAADALLDVVLKSAPSGARVFVYGVLGKNAGEASELAERAASRNLSLAAETCLPTTWRLPSAGLPPKTEVEQALVVTVGARGEAELLGASGLLSVIERRLLGRAGDRASSHGEAGVASVRAYVDDDVWKAQERGVWSRELLAAAISRSDTPQGDPVKDGRTQDLVGLGLVPGLAREPVAYVAEHRDGLRSAVLVLDGVVADINFALATRGGRTISAQFYRLPRPNGAHWSCLAEVVEQFFHTGLPPWPVQRSLLTAGLLEAFARALSAPGTSVRTPELAIAYAASAEPSYRRE